MKILLAVDGSPCSDVAVAEVAHRPWPAGSVVHVVTAEPPADPSFLRGSPTVFDEFVRQQRAEAGRRVAAAADTLRRDAPSLAVVPKVLEGWPKDAVVGEAEGWGADLVVVGSHGYGPVRQFFLGSVSLYVAQNAPCSVLIVRGAPGASPPPDGPASA